MNKLRLGDAGLGVIAAALASLALTRKQHG
jgi:hypothetical protein